MLDLIKHFGNQNLNNTKSKDTIFFNIIGSWLIIYPLSFDFPLIIISILLYVTVCVVGYKKGRIKLKHFFLGFGLLVGALLLAAGLVWVFEKGVLSLYPYYNNFYSSFFYNTKYYLISIVGITLLSFALFFGRAVSKFSYESLMMGSLLFLVLLMLGIKFSLNTGAYFIYFPLFFILITYLIIFLVDIKAEDSPMRYALSQIVFYQVVKVQKE